MKIFNFIINSIYYLVTGLIARIIFLFVLIWFRDLKKTMYCLNKWEEKIQYRKLKRKQNEKKREKSINR